MKEIKKISIFMSFLWIFIMFSFYICFAKNIKTYEYQGVIGIPQRIGIYKAEKTITKHERALPECYKIIKWRDKNGYFTVRACDTKSGQYEYWKIRFKYDKESSKIIGIFGQFKTCNPLSIPYKQNEY